MFRPARLLGVTAKEVAALARPICYADHRAGLIAAGDAKNQCVGRLPTATAMLGRRLSNDYVVITRRDPRLPTWSWEILRRSTPLGVKPTGHDFKSAMAARLAGESALKDLLHRIARGNS